MFLEIDRSFARPPPMIKCLMVGTSATITSNKFPWYLKITRRSWLVRAPRYCTTSFSKRTTMAGAQIFLYKHELRNKGALKDLLRWRDSGKTSSSLPYLRCAATPSIETSSQRLGSNTPLSFTFSRVLRRQAFTWRRRATILARVVRLKRRGCVCRMSVF